MKNLSKSHRILLLLIAAITTLSLLGCSGCASQNTVPNKVSTKVVEWELSPEAQDTYAYLLYDQALRLEDEDMVLTSLQMLKQKNLPLSTYIESSIWMMSRKSPNTLATIELGLDIYPNNISLVLLYAENLQENKQSDKAIAFMRQYLKNNKSSIDAKLEIALLLIKIQKYQEAHNELISIPEKQRTPLINYYIGRTFIGLNQSQKAIAYLQKAIKSSPKFLEAMAELAYIYEKDARLNDARKLYEKMLKLSNNNQEILLRLISLNIKQNRPQKAFELAEKKEHSIEFSMLVTTLFIESKNFDIAKKILHSIAAKDDYPQEVNFYLAAIAYEKEQDTPTAIKWLEKITKANDYHKRAKLFQIQILANNKKLEEALSLTRTIKRDYPEHNDLWQIEVRLLARLDRQKEALDVVSVALAKWSENAELIFLQGSLFDELGDKKKAMDAMEALILVNPDHYQALNYVGYTLAEESKDLSRAISLLERAILLSPHSSYIMDSLAWAQFKAGKFQEAWLNINKAVTLKGGSDSTVWEHYGDIASSLGHTQEAKKGYIEALKHIPHDFDSTRKRIENKIK